MKKFSTQKSIRLSARILPRPVRTTMLIVLLLCTGAAAYFFVPQRIASQQQASVLEPVQQFFYTFNAPGILYETSSPNRSGSPYWWLSSGGMLYIEQNVGKTIHGDLPTWHMWRIRYAATNPTDTDGGLHPQNIFRLVTKATATNVRVEALFKIEGDNLSASSQRNASNGLLLMSRYIDRNNLYYAGVRVDGTAVIKKKKNGIYVTLAQVPVFDGAYVGWQDNTNVIPHHTWLGLRSETETDSAGVVHIRLFVRYPNTSLWTPALQVNDNGALGGAPITAEGHSGIRTDFMDVAFESYQMTSLDVTQTQ